FTFEPLDGRTVSSILRQELQCDLTTEVNVLCPVDNPHTSLTKLFQHSEMRNGFTHYHRLGGRTNRLILSHQPCGHFEGGHLNELLCGRLMRQQRFHFVVKFCIITTGILQKPSTLLGRHFQRGVVQLLHSTPALRLHGACSLRDH